MEKVIRKCPMCNKQLHQSYRCYVCENKHNFDMSKEGYVNMLTGESKKCGDDQMMVESRRKFLESGWYTPLVEKINLLLGSTGGIILDIGCGEGWYLRSLQKMRKDRHDKYFGIDISKKAIKRCSKETSGSFAVGNAIKLPVMDASCDIITSIFSPYDEEEIARCLTKEGCALIVGPGSDHLYDFIELIRDKPHKHILKQPEERYMHLELVTSSSLRLSLDIQDNDTIQNLFKMTPYYRKAPIEKQQHIMQLSRLVTTADFVIDVVV